MEYIYVGIGGVFGAVTRYGISKWVGEKWIRNFPIATFFINITGAFLLGLLSTLFAKTGAGWNDIKNLTTIGFLGAYTTYSTFSLEIISLFQNGSTRTGIIYFIASIIVGLVAAYLGVKIGLAY